MKSKRSKKTEEKIVKVDEVIKDEKIVIEPESILTDEEVKDIKEDEIIDIVAEEVKVEKPKKTSTEKKPCRVVVATPTYFVINKERICLESSKIFHHSIILRIFSCLLIPRNLSLVLPFKRTF